MKDSLKENGVTLVISGTEDYQKTNREIIKTFTNEENLEGVYTTVNDPFPKIEEFLQKDDVETDKIFFVDGISKEVGAEEVEKDNVIYLESPEHLTDISIVMSKSLDGLGDDRKFIFFDSMSTLTIYNSINTVSKFAHFITEKMRNWNVAGVVISVESEEDDEVIERLKRFVDNVVEV